MDNFLIPSKPEIDISELLLNSDKSDGIFEHISSCDKAPNTVFRNAE
jgi:hypothetical protein